MADMTDMPGVIDTVDASRLAFLRAGKDMVQEFHQVFGHPVADEKCIGSGETTDEVFDYASQPYARLRFKLIAEERAELVDAALEHDTIGVADALCDLMYVVFGAMIVSGIPICDVPINETATLQSVSKEVDDVLIMIEGSATVRKYSEKMSLLLNECVAMGKGIGLAVEKGFAEVHRSNMSKISPTMEAALETVEKYKEDGRYEPAYELRNGYHIVYNSADGKILKYHGWSEPNLTQFISCPTPVLVLGRGDQAMVLGRSNEVADVKNEV